MPVWVSRECAGLVRALLRVDPAERISLDRARQHPRLALSDAALAPEALKRVLEAIRALERVSTRDPIAGQPFGEASPRAPAPRRTALARGEAALRYPLQAEHARAGP
jgi:hypothetical protein